MEKISMVDLHGQYQRIKPEIDQAIQRVLDSAVFVKGSEVKEFENELAHYLGIKHVSCLRQWHRCPADRPYGAWFETRR